MDMLVQDIIEDTSHQYETYTYENESISNTI